MKSNTGARLPEPSGRSPEPVVQAPIRRRITIADRRRIVELYVAGASSRAVAAELGVGRSTVLGVLKRAGVELRPQGNYPGRSS